MYTHLKSESLTNAGFKVWALVSKPEKSLLFYTCLFITDSAYRIDPADRLPKISSQPIGYDDAKELLRYAT